MLMLPNLKYRFNAISTEISAGSFAEISKLFLNSIWKYKRLKIPYVILKKKSKAGRNLYHQIGRHYKATVIKTLRFWCKNRKLTNEM